MSATQDGVRRRRRTSLACTTRRVCALFEHSFGRAPRAIAAAPARVNIVGEHTDYAGGLVLPFAADRWCVAAVGPARADRSGLVSAELGSAGHLVWTDRGVALQPARALSHAAHSWGRYIAAVATGLCRSGPARLQLSHPMPPAAMHLAVASSIPPGAGLASSAALELAAAVALLTAHDLPPDPLRLASLCRHAEHQAVGVPCGIMDQLTIATARARHAILIDCHTLRARYTPLRSRATTFVVVDTGTRRRLAEGDYARRVADCRRAARRLGLDALRHATSTLLQQRRHALDEPLFRLARHVCSENARVRRAAAALRRGDATTLGRLLSRSHASLRDDLRVSGPALEAAVGAAMTTPGVLGARLLGAGHAGCVLVFCRRGTLGPLRDAIARALGPPADVFDVRAVSGARPIRHARPATPTSRRASSA